MEDTAIRECVQRRDYTGLQHHVQEFLRSRDWSDLLKTISETGSRGKERDSVVTLLELEAVGGTDTDVVREFSDLEGDSLIQVKTNAVERTMEILREQIENKHTYFLDIEAMAETPYAILVKDIIEARKRELAELEGTPSRIEVLGTYYGFMILMVDGSQPHVGTQTQQAPYRYYYRPRRTWLDEQISDSAASAIKRITGDFAEEVDMDKTYRTLGGSQIFRSRCTPITANILANAVRLSLYKVPGNRSAAAAALGKTEDLRVLPFLHHRFGIDRSRKVQIRIAEAMGRVGHVDSLDILKERVNVKQRSLPKDQDAIISAIGRIYSPDAKGILLDIMNNGGNIVKGAAIQAIRTQNPEGLVGLIAPFLVDRSRPVVRASVLALTALGEEGEQAIKLNLSTILNRIGSDKPSRVAMIKMLEIRNLGQKRVVQEYFAKRIHNLRKEADNWTSRVNASSYSWWYRRRQQRVQRNLHDAISMINLFVQPPFIGELLDSVEKALKTVDGSSNIHRVLGESELSRAIIERHRVSSNTVSFEQSYFI